MGTFLIVVPLIAAIIATVTDTTRKGEPFPKRVTLGGWILVLITLVVTVVNLMQASADSRQKEIRKFVAYKELEKGLLLLTAPYIANSDPPEEKDRFQISAAGAYGQIFPAICDVDILSPVDTSAAEYYTQPQTKWGDYIMDRTERGLQRLVQIQAVYGDLLSSDVNLDIGLVHNHPWNEFLLASRDRVARAVTAGGTSSRSLCASETKLREAYLRQLNAYRQTLSHLETEVGREICRLRKHPGIEDDPPVALRRLSGWIFVASRYRGDQQTQSLITPGVCRAIQAPGY